MSPLSEAAHSANRVDERKLIDVDGYLNSLRAPAGVKDHPQLIADGRTIIAPRCTSCHNVDQSRFVPQGLVPFNATVAPSDNAPARPSLYPGYQAVVLADRCTTTPSRLSTTP